MTTSLLQPVRDGFGVSAADSEGQGRGFALLIWFLSFGLFGALWVSGRGDLLRLAIPVVCTAVAVVLYFTWPLMYTRYTVWAWCLAPLARRVIDWRFGFVEPNFVLVMPLLVSGVSALTVLIPSRRAGARIPPVFLLCGGGIFYGLIVGAVFNQPAEVIFGFCNWLCPMLFGLHLFLTFRNYEEHREALTRTFLWAILFLSVYGIVQYASPAAWDRFWLQNVMTTSQNLSFGRPEPFLIRVWSTLNAPGVFANVVLVGLLLVFASRSFLKVPAALFGYPAFLLTVVRTAWLSWLLGIFIILKSSRPKVMVRAIALGLLLVAALLPFANDSRLANLLGDRVKSFSNLSEDASFGARVDMYQILFDDIATHPFGHGMSNQTRVGDMAIDSGILAMLFALGWLGSALFACGIASAFSSPVWARATADPFVSVSRAIVISLLAQILGGNVFVSATGFLFWTFFGMLLSQARTAEFESAR